VESTARDRALLAAMGLLCCAYAVWGLLQARDTALATDSLHNAILSRNLARGDGYVVHIIQYHAGTFGSVEHVPEMHGVLQPLLVAGLFALFGPGETLARIPPFVFAAATGLLSFVFARRLFGSGAGLLACLLVLGNSLLFTWARYATDDAGFACLFVATLLLLHRGLAGGQGRFFLLAGLTGGAAVLQKATGLILLPILLGVVLLDRGARARMSVQGWLVLLGPVALCTAVYFARNAVAHGGLAFRWGAIDWLYKSEGISAFHRLYESAPTLWATLDSIGWGRVGSIALGQLADFLRAVFSLHPFWAAHPARLTDPGILAALGLVLLPLHFRRHRCFFALVALSVLVSAALVCGVWHLELRFFSMLVPLLCISFAGIIARGAAGVGPGALRIPLRAIALGAAVASVGVAGQWLRWTARSAPVHQDPCRDANEWIERETGREDRILAFHPWRLTWATDRPAIHVPSGGPGAVTEVVRRYGPSWLLVSRRTDLPDVQGVVRAMLKRPTASFPARRVFDGRRCDVYDLRPQGGRSPGR